MKPKSTRYQSCSLYAATGAKRRLWQFNVGKEKLSPSGDLSLTSGQALPSSVSRDWRSLVQPRLNIAWLPANQLFVRVIQLPAVDASEAPGMVEFQLEKLSPLPPTQVVWTAEVLPSKDSVETTVLVIVVPKAAVEQFLSELESTGFVTDRLEVPLVRELRQLQPTGDGIWIIADDVASGSAALIGWFVGGIWREVALLNLTEGSAGLVQLTQHLECVAWGADIAGWLKSMPPIHLLASPETAEALTDGLRSWSGGEILTDRRKSDAELAEQGAIFQLRTTTPSLVPHEITARQKNELIDRLWVKGLGSLGMIYLCGVCLYIMALKYQESRVDDARSDVLAAGKQYTNTLQLKEQIAVLQNQIDLRFAALDSWRAAAENLPETLTLTSLSFDKGRTLKLGGTVPNENRTDVNKFNGDLKKVMVNGQPLFSKVTPANFSPAGNSSTWYFDAELKRTETP